MSNDTGVLKTVAVVGIAVVISAILSLTIGISNLGLPAHEPPVGFEPIIRMKLFVTSANTLILLALLWNYITVYRDLPNRFTLSLLLFTVALLLYAVSSNPLFPLVFGYSVGTTLGPFVFLPDVFASIAAIVLLYQSFA